MPIKMKHYLGLLLHSLFKDYDFTVVSTWFYLHTCVLDKLNIVLDIAFSARNFHKRFTAANLLTVYFMAHLTHSKRRSLPGGFLLFHLSKGRSIV